MQPVNWTRSRIRRRHLISLGIPVNLDEVLPKANGKLPTLEITTRPMSAPPGPRTAPVQKTIASQSSSRVGSRPGTPVTSLPNAQSMSVQSMSAQLRLGPRPELDENKVNQLLELNPGENAKALAFLLLANAWDRQVEAPAHFHTGETSGRFAVTYDAGVNHAHPLASNAGCPEARLGDLQQTHWGASGRCTKAEHGKTRRWREEKYNVIVCKLACDPYSSIIPCPCLMTDIP